MLKRGLYLFIGLVLPLLSFGNDDTHVLFVKGNDYYAKAQYKEALNTYHKILDEGYQSSVVYFNMGNASYKLEDIPSALLYYEKAHKLNPADDDINFNIRFANLKTVDKIDAVPEFFLARWWRMFILSFSVGTLSILSIVFVLVGSVLLILYFFADAVLIKKTSFYAAVTLFFLGILTIFIAGKQVNYFEDHRQAIVFSSSVNVKSGPGEHLNTLFVLHEGTKVNALESSNGWEKIRLANGNEGWIKVADVREI
ncbi:MAG: Tetratricopeptide repeat protein [Mucilaginibacter sp.]|nr:Tetratricopeptide repeat protein [Mucilaginibacter sp.]MDB5016822.1 Tetratricopeptide repeat protein [Mucilaginibacter sp.]